MIATERLVLRRWREEDAAAHHALMSDPVFMATLGPPLPYAESVAVVARQNALLDRHGSCFWAMEERATGRFVGYCGIRHGPAGTAIEEEPEIGWGVAPDRWRRGLATEAAGGVLGWAWANRPWPHVAAITSTDNVASRAVMARLGMVHAPGEDFDHPAVPEGSALRRHVVYRIARP